MNKASTLEKLGRNEEALAVLAEAAPLVEGGGRERLRFGVHFGVVVNLCELGRHAEAEPLVSEVRDMAVGFALKLYLRRLRWLEGRVAGGLGRTEEAIATLTAVKDEFANQGIAYDAALATLELAVLLLDHGRTAEVKRLAEQSKKIFDAQGVAREALATLQVFRQAVAREAMTAALARRLMEDLRGTAKGGEAKSSTRQVMRRDPRDIRRWVCRGATKYGRALAPGAGPSAFLQGALPSCRIIDLRRRELAFVQGVLPSRRVSCPHAG